MNKRQLRLEAKQLPHKKFLGGVLVISLCLLIALSANLLVNGYQNSKSGLAQGQSSMALVSNSNVNQDGGSFVTGSSEVWLGTGENKDSSYLGLQFDNVALPTDASITNATLEFVPSKDQWIFLSFKIYGDKSNLGQFSKQSKMDTRTLSSASTAYSANENWTTDKSYKFDVTDIVNELKSGGNTMRFIVKGDSSKWARKFIISSGDKAPKLLINYESGITTVITPTPIVTASPNSNPTITPTPRATSTPRPTSTPLPTNTPVPSNTGTPVPTTVPTQSQNTGVIFGLVTSEILGTCSSAVHDRYVVTGPDGVLYRTWHPTTVPVDINNPSGAKCTFAHEHGDNPATSKIYTGTEVPFGYIANQIGMDEPHVGFKCFVGNAGTTNDEGRSALHNSYFCFHMGTGGAARFTTRFHSLDFKMITNDGRKMYVQGMSDTGNVGTICDNPRNSRTVMGLGCKVDSSYEIWSNSLKISNQGNTVAEAVVSTAVFDPITVMDPNDKTKLIYTWSDEAKNGIFKFNDNRSYYRGCNRESYHGPAMWYNTSGSTVYYTDAYGNVSPTGMLKQEISKSGYKDFIATNDGLSQFKITKSYCTSGLGLKN